MPGSTQFKLFYHDLDDSRSSENSFSNQSRSQDVTVKSLKFSDMAISLFATSYIQFVFSAVPICLSLF